MKETFTGKKDSVINITLLHPPQKLFGCWKLSLGSRGPAPPAPADAPECWRCPKSLCKEGPPRSSPVSTSATLLFFLLLFLPFGCCNGMPPTGRAGAGDTRGRPQRAEPSASSQKWDNGPSVTSYLRRSCHHSQHWGQAPWDVTSGHGETQAEAQQLGKPLPLPVLLTRTELNPAWKH